MTLHRLLAPGPKSRDTRFLKVGATYLTASGRRVVITDLGSEVLCKYLDVPEREYVSFEHRAARKVLVREDQ